MIEPEHGGPGSGWLARLVGLLTTLALSVGGRLIGRRTGAHAAAEPARPSTTVTGQGESADSTHERRTTRLAAAGFIVAGVAGIALFGVYVAGGHTQLEGALLAVCLGGLGGGIALWSRDLMPTTELIEEREDLSSPPGDLAPPMTRRTMLLRSLAFGLAGLGAALILPVLSLGPSPGDTLRRTSWRRGLRLVDETGMRIQSDSFAVDTIVTAFPEGAVGVADSQVILIRVPNGSLAASTSKLAPTPPGFIAYSKICTHAGCPVGLYRASEHQLICPCHQSTFDVIDGAVPTFGPAVRPLPQLPIALTADDGFEALGDFTGPVGPSFWDIGRGEVRQ